MDRSDPQTGKIASKKHHYLPRHYLRGFTNSKGMFFVYDKNNGNIFPSSPNNAFFENNLNTVTFPNGDSSDFLEDMYTETENQSWGPFDRIKKSTHTHPIVLLDKMHLFLFLSFLYWRLPSNLSYVEKLSEKAFLNGGEFDYLKITSKNGQTVPKEIIEMLKNSKAFKKCFAQIIPFIPFYKDKNWAKRLDNWRFLYTGDNKSWYIVGDNPIIAKEESRHDIINCLKESMFPISGKILVINIEQPINRGLSPEFGIEFNTAIIQQARRFVACQDKGFLEALIKYHNLYVQYDKANTIVPELFRMVQSETTT
jgi:Protein of unknown function (DUF4238)